MKQRILAIPIEEVRRHFQTNRRQDIKIVVPEILSDETYRRLMAAGEYPEREDHLEGIRWNHAPNGMPNPVCNAGDFVHEALPGDSPGPFCLAFADQGATQDEHYHARHIELYYSESPMTARYRILGRENEEDPIELSEGGVIVFGPEVIHAVFLKGLTIVLEFPAVTDDKKKQVIGKKT